MPRGIPSLSEVQKSEIIKRVTDKGELIEAIALQIYYYNHRRIHSALKMPPTIFYQRCVDQQNTENKTKKFQKNCALLHIPLQGDMQNNQLIA